MVCPLEMVCLCANFGSFLVAIVFELTVQRYNFIFVIQGGTTDTVSSNPKIYLNGQEQSLTLYGSVNPYVPYIVNKYAWIGRSAFAGDSYNSANMYSFRMYNRALTAEEVLQNYNATKTRFGIS